LFLFAFIVASMITFRRKFVTRHFWLRLCDRYGVTKENDRRKFLESATHGVYYLGAWIMCASYVLRQDYFWDTIYLWEGDFPHQPLHWHVYWLYVVNVGWYLHCVYAHCVLEKSKSDFWEMFAHHVITLVLLYFSFVNGFVRFGTLVLFSMDLCDVFLHLAKVVKLIVEGLNFDPPLWTEVLLFAPVPVSWIIFRLSIFPAKVLYASWMHCPELCGFLEYCRFYWGFNIFLTFLFLLQVYWFYLIMKIVYRRIFLASPLDDVREDEGETEQVPSTKTIKTN